MDVAASNYKSYLVKHDESTCEYGLEGCMDITACNWDPLATVACSDCCLWIDSTTMACTCSTPDGCVTGISLGEGEHFSIEVSSNLIGIDYQGMHSLTLTDVNGQVVHTETARGTKQYKISRIVKPGIYVVQITMAGRTYNRRILVI
jgi:hypothetical protein